jgi:methyl-accepting chemotaxis protein
MNSILRQEAIDQMIYTTEGQSAAIEDWASVREQILLSYSQTESLKQGSDPLLLHPEDQVAIDALQVELSEMLKQEDENFFHELLVVRISDLLIVSSTNSESIGSRIEGLPDKMSVEIQTVPMYDEPILSPDSLTLLSIAPFRTIGSQPDFFLIGVNAESKVRQLLKDLQIYWQRRAVYGTEKGETYLILLPNLAFALSSDDTQVDSRLISDHPVLQTSMETEVGTLEYTSSSGESLLSTYHWIPGWDLAVVVELPRTEISSGLSDLAPFMIILIIVASVITLSVGFLVTNHMLEPLKSLTEFASRMSHGEWLYRIPEGHKDELGELAASLNRMAEELGALYQSLETRVEGRTRQIQTASEVARAIISIPNLNELLRQAVQLIQDRFGYDHVSISLLDSEGHYAVLREAAGIVDEESHATGRKFELGIQSAFGWVSETIAPLVITETSNHADSFKEGLLPGLKSEAVIPLQVAGNALGVIDVQSKDVDVFGQDELEILQTLADQLSTAIENARLAQESADAAERARLISEITGQLSGILEPQQVLHRAAHALHRALGNAEIIVRLAPQDEARLMDEESLD